MKRVPFREGLFREAARGPALLASRCTACGRTFFPRVAACRDCGRGAEDTQLREGARLYTFTVVHMPVHRYKPPFALGWVEFPGGVRVMSQLKGWEGRALRLGMPVRLVVDTLWEEDGAAVVGYKFEPAGEGGGP